jgi:hypothetical protein
VPTPPCQEAGAAPQTTQDGAHSVLELPHRAPDHSEWVSNRRERRFNDENAHGVASASCLHFDSSYHFKSQPPLFRPNARWSRLTAAQEASSWEIQANVVVCLLSCKCFRGASAEGFQRHWSFCGPVGPGGLPRQDTCERAPLPGQRSRPPVALASKDWVCTRTVPPARALKPASPGSESPGR